VDITIKRVARRPVINVTAVARQAHWLLGVALIAAVLLWSKVDILGSWSSEFRRPQYIVNVLLLYLLVAMGLNVLSGYAGAASIGHIALFGIGAYTEAILTTEHGWGYAPAVVAGGFVAMLAALPVGLILLRLSGWYFSVVTLLLVVVVNDLWIQQQDLTGGGAGIFGLFLPAIGDHSFDLTDYLYLILAVDVVVFLLLRYLLDRSRWGRALIAVRDVEPAARAAGVHPFMVRESALALSAFLAGLAGAMFAPMPGQINPESFPIVDSIFFLLAVLAGGMGTVIGPVVGTIFLYVVPQVLAEQKSLSQYSFLVYGVLLLMLVIFLPEGIVGGVRRLWYRLLGARAAPQGTFAATDDAVDSVAAPALADTAAAPIETTAALAYLHRNGAPPPEYAVEARDITIRFGDVVAVREVTLRVRTGTIHAVIGPNGSGKTTLLNIMSGFYRQNAGDVQVFGKQLPRGGSTRAIRLGMARTFQMQQVLPQLSVLENVMLGCHPWGQVTFLDGMLPLPHVWQERRRFRATALACLDLVGLGRGVADLPCGQLPFAHQRLVEIARAVAGRPQILLLDEPASGLHAEEVRAFVHLVRRLKEAGLTIVLVEHNFGLVSELADVITVLDAGRLLAEGTFETVRSDPQVVEAYLGA
jgi:branched-chain amino acid transport system permease protein